MGIALLSRYSRRLLMQFDSTREIPPVKCLHKRPFAQASALQHKPRPPKVPRIDTPEFTSSFARSRQAESLSASASSTMPLTPSRVRTSGRHKSHLGTHTSPNRPLPQKRTVKRPHHKHLEGNLHDEAYISSVYRNSTIPIKRMHESVPKSSVGNFAALVTEVPPSYKSTEGYLMNEGTGVGTLVWRTTTTVHLDPPVIGIGDSPVKKESERLAALSIVYQLHASGLLDNPSKLRPKRTNVTEVTLSDNSIVNYERARSFMDYYCRQYGFGKPEILLEEQQRPDRWEAVMTVGGRRIGLGSASNKKAAQVACYLDVTQYLESCDPPLWKKFVEAAKTGADLGLAPKVFFHMSDRLDDEVRDLCADIKKSKLYRNRPAQALTNLTSNTSTVVTAPHQLRQHSHSFLAEKSRRLLSRRQEYLLDPAMAKMRSTRMSLPVYARAEDLLSHIRTNDVTICMAATGSGKTTQIPQIILDSYIERGEGAQCNILCTQPRRLAAISVANRVASERGEGVGKSVGYQVRFENKLPDDHGSITFCTTGVFLKRLQSAFSRSPSRGHNMDDVTHIIVDEVHERDVDTDLLLVVLKRLLADRKAKGQPLKIILMSATIDPTLFQHYFLDDNSQPAKVIEVPGRSYPVSKYFLDEFLPKLITNTTRWILREDPVMKYLDRELGPSYLAALGISHTESATSSSRDENIELPHALIAATISHVLQTSDDGHVLVFLPGWEDLVALQRSLLTPSGPLGVDFGISSKYSIILLHSAIPTEEQQVIFDPPPTGVRRIILATNIAETSVTIPDVVYVIDTARVKEQRYDPDRRMSSLVSAWVGLSNLNQRAGRAGRHRPGEYYGILSRTHAETLDPYQTVEMKRVDLSNVVMHVKALNFPGMTVDEVLAATIEAPLSQRVAAAMKDLQMVGALDVNKNLTSLGRVLLQLPVEVQVGRLVLYGSFFRCLDQALTLAAILTNREPFVSPMHLKAESTARKNSWTPREFRSDALAALQAFNAWWAMQSRGDYISANKFCIENFLAKPTLLVIQKIKKQLLQSLYQAGVIGVSAGGLADASNTPYSVPPELNTNGNSLPLLAALISIASQPKFAVRVGTKTFRTSQDKITFIHPSSVNSWRTEQPSKKELAHEEKQLYAFTEKRQNVSTGAGSAQTYLVTTTRLDPMSYLLFGAHKIQTSERGLECDNWLPVGGNLDALDDVHHLKELIESCMLRVFEGITMRDRYRRRYGLLKVPASPREEEEFPDDDDDDNNGKIYSLSQDEVKELDLLTRDVVRILNRYSQERMAAQSLSGVPMESPSLPSTSLHGSRSGYSTPTCSASSFNSRPGTPDRQSKI